MNFSRFLVIFFIFIISIQFICTAEDSLAKKLHALIAKDPPKWMLEQIEEDLAPFQENGITRETLDRLAEITQNQMIVRVRIVSGKITYFVNPFYYENKDNPCDFYKKRLQMFLKGLTRLVENTSLPDVEFIATVNDYAYSNIPYPAPLFVFSKINNLKTHVLIPDAEALNGYSFLNDVIAQGSQQFPWNQKQEKIFWRGATTDGWYFDLQDWESHPRARLVLLSLIYPDLINARFTCFCHGAEKNVAMLAIPALLSNPLSPRDSLVYKYLMDIDGLTCGWSRCYWSLLSNSVVFKQTTENIQWFYGALEPYYHYIPVKKDLSNLLEQLHWAKDHDKEVKKIADQGSRFVENNLSEEMILLYLYWLFVYYAEIQHFN